MDEFPIVTRVKSSKKDFYYDIRQTPDGALICECKGFRWRGTCRHLAEAKENLVPKLKFKLVFKHGPTTIAEVTGLAKEYDDFRVGDVTERVIEAEQYLERLTGLRVHIETAED